MKVRMKLATSPPPPPFHPSVLASFFLGALQVIFATGVDEKSLQRRLFTLTGC